MGFKRPKRMYCKIRWEGLFYYAKLVCGGVMRAAYKGYFRFCACVFAPLNTWSLKILAVKRNKNLLMPVVVQNINKK